MQYRFYIFDPYAGAVKGTNEEDHAKAFAGCDDFFVVDSEKGEWFVSSDEKEAVRESH